MALLQLLQAVLNHLQRRVNNHIDGYVSTDASEVEEILSRKGFQVASDEEDRDTFTEADEEDDDWKFNFDGSYVRTPQAGLEIYCRNVPLEEALGKRENIGFIPMSKFRVYASGNQNADNILLPIIEALDAERQNMAFINDNGSMAYVKLSEFYRQ